MGKRYYCDYCDRSFQDNMHNRKKHLNGVQHHRAKKAWYDHFKDLHAVLLEEQAKKPCRMFLQKGVCNFAPNCRFSHMSEEDFFKLKQQVEVENLHDNIEDQVLSDRTVEGWLCKREKKLDSLCGPGELETEVEECSEESDVPQQLFNIPDLPPSLMPPPQGGWRVGEHTDWG